MRNRKYEKNRAPWRAILNRLKSVDPSNPKPMQRRDKINIGLAIAQVVAALMMVVVSVALWKVNSKLADFQELDIRSRAKAQIELEAEWDCSRFTKLPMPGVWIAIAFIKFKNTSVWPITNLRIEWRHWDSGKWLGKIPDKGQIKLEGMISPGEVRPQFINSQTASDPKVKIKKDGLHFPFAVRFTWDDPNTKSYEKVQYVDIYSLQSSESPLPEPYIACRVSNNHPKDIPEVEF